MADFTQPQFALPFTVAGTLTVAYDSGADTVVTVSSAVRWNDRTGSASTDAFAYVVDALNTADTGRTWAGAELTTAGGFRGLCVIIASNITDGRAPTTMTFSGGLTGKMFGYTSNAVSAVAGVGSYYYSGSWLRQYLWIPQLESHILQSINELTRLDAVVATSSPDGTTTRDYYGGVDMRNVVIMGIPAACIWQHYASDSDYTDVVGAAAGDQNMALDEFRKLWRDGLPTSTSYCRYWPDLLTLGTYRELEAGGDAAWIGDLKQALSTESQAPYKITLDVTLFDMGGS